MNEKLKKKLTEKKRQANGKLQRFFFSPSILLCYRMCRSTHSSLESVSLSTTPPTPPPTYTPPQVEQAGAAGDCRRDTVRHSHGHAVWHTSRGSHCRSRVPLPSPPFPLSLRVLLTLPSSQLFLVWVLGTSRDVLPVTTRPLRDSSTTEELAITSSNVLLMFVNRFDRQFN